MQRTGPHFRSEPDPTSAQTRAAPTAAIARTNMPPAGARSQLATERSPQNRRPAPRPPILTRPWFILTSGASAAALGFAAVLWLTSPATVPPSVAILTSSTISDASSLMAAVQTAGLRGTPDVRGAIDGIKRIDNESVTIKGWAVDKAVSSSWLTVVAFASGRHVLTVVTNGARKEVAQMYGLSDAATRNVSFEASFKCGKDENLIIVAVTLDGKYSQFGSVACP
jgi:hypothetical protein